MDKINLAETRTGNDWQLGFESDERSPVVSIVMPAYNAAATIAESIDCVVRQTYENWKLIVVNDNSSDNTKAIVESYCARDPRIVLLNQDGNKGVAEARNLALRSTRTAFVAFLDSDDLWEPEKLQAQVKFMVENGHAITYTFYRRFKEDLQNISDVVVAPAALTYEQLLRNSAMACLTVMLDRRRCGDVMFSKIRHEDFALWLQVLKRGLVAHCLPQDLARYRVSENSLSSNKFKSSAWVWKVYRKSERLSLLKSFVCFSQYLFRAVKKRVGQRGLVGSEARSA